MGSFFEAVARRLLEHCYTVARVFWVVARVLLAMLLTRSSGVAKRLGCCYMLARVIRVVVMCTGGIMLLSCSELLLRCCYTGAGVFCLVARVLLCSYSGFLVVAVQFKYNVIINTKN